MSIILRSEKGAPLTIEEMDGNFRELLIRLEKLENGECHVEGLKSAYLEGDEVVFMTSLDRELGRFRLPSLVFCFKGMWAPHTLYAFGDIITLQRNAWICQEPHTSEGAFHEGPQWRLLLDGLALYGESSHSNA